MLYSLLDFKQVMMSLNSELHVMYLYYTVIMYTSQNDLHRNPSSFCNTLRHYSQVLIQTHVLEILLQNVMHEISHIKMLCYAQKEGMLRLTTPFMQLLID